MRLNYNPYELEGYMKVIEALDQLIHDAHPELLLKVIEYICNTTIEIYDLNPFNETQKEQRMLQRKRFYINRLLLRRSCSFRKKKSMAMMMKTQNQI